MKKHNPKFSVGSLYLCNKCGLKFNNSENAEQLKSSLRSELKNENNDHKKIRVMVSGCLGICESGEQVFSYYPNEGLAEIYAIDQAELSQDNQAQGFKSILHFINNKIKKN